jgi:hypothetical protein
MRKPSLPNPDGAGAETPLDGADADAGAELPEGLRSLLEIAQRAGSSQGAGPKPGKKGIRWDRDPDILMRLEAVAGMLVRGAKLQMIAAAMQYSMTTAKRDVARVRLLWAREASAKAEAARDQSIAQLRAVQQQAWARWDAEHKAGFLRIVVDCEQVIADWLGITKRETTVTLKSEGGVSMAEVQRILANPDESQQVLANLLVSQGYHRTTGPADLAVAE